MLCRMLFMILGIEGGLSNIEVDTLSINLLMHENLGAGGRAVDLCLF